jgi:hypothetical protein
MLEHVLATEMITIYCEINDIRANSRNPVRKISAYYALILAQCGAVEVFRARQFSSYFIHIHEKLAHVACLMHASAVYLEK